MEKGNGNTDKNVTIPDAGIERQKQLLDITLASIGDGVIVADSQGKVVFLNAEAERLTYIGGSMNIKSAPGQGTTITLDVPILQARVVAQQHDVEPDVSRLLNEFTELHHESAKENVQIRVLLADDHKIVREGLRGCAKITSHFAAGIYL